MALPLIVDIGGEDDAVGGIGAAGRCLCRWGRGGGWSMRNHQQADKQSPYEYYTNDYTDPRLAQRVPNNAAGRAPCLQHGTKIGPSGLSLTPSRMLALPHFACSFTLPSKPFDVRVGSRSGHTSSALYTSAC